MRDTSPVYAGRILSRYYTTEEKILQLMDMGDISLGRLINAPFWIDYIYIFSASGGWQYLSYHE